jgi:hypothetical protein
MDELSEKIARAKMAAEGTLEPTEEHLANMEQHAKNFVAMVEAWFQHHFGVSAAEAAAKANETVSDPEADPMAEGDKP